MALLWHGYIAFDLSAHTTGEQSSVMAALKTELDETQNADQPAERWHTTSSGGVYIAEATFDLAKLSTTNLNAVAQAAVAAADLTGLWEPMRPGQSWSRSLEKAQSWDSDGYTVFLPEGYGTVDGTPANDMAAVQAAVNAAIANGEGRVVCNGTYQVDSIGVIEASLGNTRYAILIDGDNVGIEGSGTFVLGSVPTNGGVTVFSFGNSGGDGGKPGDDGSWRYNNWIKDITIDASALTNAERVAVTGGPVGFHYCQDFACRNVTVTGGWGNYGTIRSIHSSRYGVFMENTITDNASTRIAFIGDGARYLLVIHNESESTSAFTFQANLDNCTYGVFDTGVAQNCFAVGNIFTGLGTALNRLAVSITGCDDVQIIGNTFTKAAGEYYFGISIIPFSRAPDGSAWSNRCIIKDNAMTTGGSQRPFQLSGTSDNKNTEGTDPMLIEGLAIQGNTINDATRKAYFVNGHINGAVISGNTYNNATIYGYANAGDEATIVAANTLQ